MSILRTSILRTSIPELIFGVEILCGLEDTVQEREDDAVQGGECTVSVLSGSFIFPRLPFPFEVCRLAIGSGWPGYQN